MTSARPFRFAVQAYAAADAAHAMSAAEWRDLARQVEDLGYSTLFVADHYLDRGRAPQHLAPIASMATAAAVTSTLRVGSRVFCVDYHVPAVLAKEAATLDLLSDGRLELGLGAGWSETEYTAMGLTFAEGRRRVDKLEEVIRLVKAHFSGAEMDCRGAFVNVTGYAGSPPPVQRPHPPLMVGGGRPRVLSLAAREADIVSLSGVPVTPVNDAGLTPHEVAEQRLAVIRAAAGARYPELDVESSPYFTAVTGSPEGPLARAGEWFSLDPQHLADHPNVLIGTEDEVVDRLVERRERFGVNYVTVPEQQAVEFAAVVARLSGR